MAQKADLAPDDIKMIKDETGLTVIVKGNLRAEDVDPIIGAGADAIQQVSNAPGITLLATRDSCIAIIGGHQLSKRYIGWNFVSSRRERIEWAKADWKAGAVARAEGDEEEFIPLPE